MAIAERRRVGVEFVETRIPKTLEAYPDKAFNMAVSLETLEYIPPELLPGYLAQVARLTDGPFLITVPVEIGPLFLAKHVIKLAFYGDSEKYTAREALAATFGRTQSVKRNEHKGFDYRQLVAQLRKWFDVETVEGLPRMGLPPMLSLTVGIVAHPKKTLAPPRRA